MTELGYDCNWLPRFDTTASAEYGLLIPSYLGLAHHASTSFNCCSYKASSAAPAFCDSRRSWNESDGWVADIGFSRGFSADILWADIVKFRIMIFEDFLVATLRGTVEATLRNIVKDNCPQERRQEKKGSTKIRPYLSSLINQ